MYCKNCGKEINGDANFCPYCGCSIKSTTNQSYNESNYNSNVNTTNAILGTLVTVVLLGGIRRQLYYWNGRYFLDPYCLRPFGFPRRIIGGPFGPYRGPHHIGGHGPGGFGGHGPGGFGGHGPGR